MGRTNKAVSPNNVMPTGGYLLDDVSQGGYPGGVYADSNLPSGPIPPENVPIINMTSGYVQQPAPNVGRETKKKEGSIAGKLHRMVVARRLFGYTCLNMILIFVTCFSYVYYMAKEASFSLNRIRDVSFEGNSLRTFRMILEGRSDTLVLQPGLGLTIFVQVMAIVLGYEILSVLRVVLFDRFPIRRSLKPLREMAETAQIISDTQWNEEKLQNLTYAISHVDAESPSDHVRTNDRELTGIEKALNDLIDRMRDAARQQTRFVSDASHELRTPIAVIKGYADMLDRWGKEDRQILEEAISAIRTESDHMNTLVEQLLFLARGDAGRQQLTLQSMSLTSIMKEVYEESEMIDKNHSYEFHQDGGGEVMCYGDAAMLKQSIRILVDNAAKYTTVGDTITLRVGISPDYRPYYSVQDNGVGMSSHDVEHIFERFYRSDTARNSKTGGTGLGLSIAKWIINRHHGTIKVQSRPEIGTRFTIFLHTHESSYSEAVLIGA
ncbi:MAG: HAMP domain-containing histidine kinase [Lachnospiraceae bacterium]|nr:HAMP domain-containing histidine kinase [Lachnospiraceae bacterium]